LLEHVCSILGCMAASTPASVLGADGLIPAPVVAELAKSAKLRPLIAPAGVEPHYIPSTRLAAFVRARDLTCLAPGCDRPATDCDIEHIFLLCPIPTRPAGMPDDDLRDPYRMTTSVACECRDF
jgi:hypothetical protein